MAHDDGAVDFLFAQMVLNGGTDGRTRYLSRKTVEFMLSDHLVGKAGVPAGTMTQPQEVASAPG